ncbi:hypothetical protein GGI43DRAFT_414540 [Trichoderma evansii]
MDQIRPLPRSRLPNVSALVDTPVVAAKTSCERFLSWRQRTDLFSPDASSAHHDDLVSTCIYVWSVGGVNIGRLNLPLYCEVDFAEVFPDDCSLPYVSPTDSPEVHFWRVAFNRSAADLAFALRLVDEEPSNAVYIPAELAHPQGWFFHSLFLRPERVKALFVAFYGRANPRLCSHCIRSITSTVNCAREHVLFPFHDCISLPGRWGGDCANCLWSAHSDCSWRFYPGYQLCAEDRGCTDVCFHGRDWAPTSRGKQVASYLHSGVAPRLSRIFHEVVDLPSDCKVEVDRIRQDLEDGHISRA